MKHSLELHHIGLATNDMVQTKKYLKQFFDFEQISDEVYDPNQKATLCMLTASDGTRIELIEGEVVKNYIKKRNFVYHICYQTEDLDNVIQDFIADGGMLISEPKEAVLFENRKVAFLMTELGLIELVEKA